jgi:hypothetical protein
MTPKVGPTPGNTHSQHSPWHVGTRWPLLLGLRTQQRKYCVKSRHGAFTSRRFVYSQTYIINFKDFKTKSPRHCSSLSCNCICFPVGKWIFLWRNSVSPTRSLWSWQRRLSRSPKRWSSFHPKRCWLLERILADVFAAENFYLTFPLIQWRFAAAKYASGNSYFTILITLL